MGNSIGFSLFSQSNDRPCYENSFRLIRLSNMIFVCNLGLSASYDDLRTDQLH